MKCIHSFVAYRLSLVALMLGLVFQADAAGERKSQLKGVQTLVARSLEECDDPQERAMIQRMLFSLFPEELRRAEAMLRRNREEAEEIVGEAVDQAWELRELQEDNPGRYETAVRLRQLNNQAAVLGRKVAGTKGAEQAALLAQLKKNLAAFFDLKQEQMKRNAADMKAELQHLEGQIRRRSQRREALVERRLRQLVDGDLEW